MSYITARRLSLFRALFIITAVACAQKMSLGMSLEQSRGSEQLRAVNDILTVADDTGVTIYVSDPRAGGIFYAKRPLHDDGSMKFADFKLLKRTAPDYPAPSGLAYWKQKLIVCDPVANAVFEMDVSSSVDSLKPIPLRGLIRAPEYLAVSESGLLAVASDTQVQYFLSGTQEPRFVTSEIRDVDRLSLDGDGLLVLDEDGAGDVFSFNADREASQARKDFVKPWSNRIRDQLPNIQDFALYRGLYYIAGHSDIRVFPRTGPGAKVEPLVMSIDLPAGISIAKISVSPSTLYVADQEKQSILALKRPVPMLIDFPQADSSSINDQVSILELLQERGPLLTRSVVSHKAYDRLNDFIRSELFAELGDTVVQPDNNALFRMARLICKLNEWRCSEQKTQEGLALERESGSIGLKNVVIVPASRVQGHVSWRTYQPPTGKNNFEAYLTGLEVIPLDRQTISLNPGQLVHIEKETDGTPNITGQCELDPSGAVVDVSPTLFPNELLISPEEFVRQVGGKVTASDLQKWGVSTIIANYSDVQYSRLKLSTPDKYKRCFAGPSLDADTYVVDRVLSASAARYKFLDRKGRVLSLDEKTLGWFNPVGREDPTKEWSWILSTPLNLGYMALTFPSAMSGQWAGAGYLKPTKRLTKVYAQQFTVLVEAAKVVALLTDVNKLGVSRTVPFYASSAQTQLLPAANQSLPYEISTHLPPDLTLADALKQREALTKLIHFSSDLSKLDLEQWKIGVVENLGSIDDRHQCFYDDEGVWTWWVNADSADSEADPSVISRVPGRVRSGSDFDEAIDHGTHVAGIIAAKSVLPGLMPKLKLVKIDSTNFPAEVENRIVDVPIFNLSTMPPGADSVYDGLINKIKDNKLGQVFFVVAAGNVKPGKKGTDYSKTEPTKPVSWLRRIPNNLIVVGASTSTDPIARLPESNYSKKFVQLFAPGDGIFSATNSNTYAPASGSSQAAPQVAAVVALLRSKGLSAVWTKAVLIYTADWNEDLMEQVWGGVLNANRAFASTSENPNSIWFSKDQKELLSVRPKERQDSIKISPGALGNDPSEDAASQQIFQSLSIPFDNVLRVQQVNDGLFRIVYLEKEGESKGELKMLLNAQITGGIKCVIQKDSNGKPLTDDLCNKYQGEISFTKIYDYVKRVPLDKFVKFSPPR